MSTSEFTTKLSNCTITKVEVDTDHYYFVDDDYYVSLTHILDVGAPFPEGLKQWLRVTDADESAERLEFAKDRGSKLHRALDDLTKGLELYAEDFPPSYEKDAITTFIRTMQFLFPEGFPADTRSELIVADTKRKVGGTLDFVSLTDRRRLDLLLNPTHKLVIDKDGHFQPKAPLSGRKIPVKFVLDYKFTGRSSYNHKVQVSKYQRMFNESYTREKKSSRAYIWRFSPKHKFHFDFQETTLPESSFNRIYDTAIEYLGGFPKPPNIVVYADRFRLFDKQVKET